MSPYPVIGQVTAFMNGFIKENIQFKNIKDIVRNNEECKILTKDGKEYQITIKQLN